MVVPLGLLNYTPTAPYVFGSPARQGLVAEYLANYPQANSQFLSAEQPPVFGVTQPRGDYVAVTPYVPEPVEQPVYRAPRDRRSIPDEPSNEIPIDAPSFSMNIADATYDHPALSDATSQAAMDIYGVEDFGAIGGANQAEVNANLAAQAAEAGYNATKPSMPSFSDITSQPVGQTINQALDAFTTPTAILGGMLSMATGIPGLGFALDAMAGKNLSNVAYDRAMEMQGVPGYSTGQIDGRAFSISPGPFGFGQVLSGNVPSWFDVDMAQAMQSVQNGIDPNTGDALSGFTPGVGGYNAQGQYVDAYGNISAMGTMGNLQTLANQQFAGDMNAARKALTRARQGIKPLRIKRRGYFEFDDDPGFGFDLGSGGVGAGALNAATIGALEAMGLDPNSVGDYDFGVPGPSLTNDPSYGEFGGGISSGFGASFDDGYDGYGGPGDADDGAGLGGEDV